MTGRRCTDSTPIPDKSRRTIFCSHCGSDESPDLLICICNCHKKSEDSGLVHRQCVEGFLKKTLTSHCPWCRSKYFIPPDCDDKLRRMASRLALVQIGAAVILMAVLATAYIILTAPGPEEDGDDDITFSGLAQLVVSPRNWWSESIEVDTITTVEPPFPSLGRSSQFMQRASSKKRSLGHQLALRFAAVVLMAGLALSLFLRARSIQSRRRLIAQELKTLDSKRLTALMDELLGTQMTLPFVEGAEGEDPVSPSELM